MVSFGQSNDFVLKTDEKDSHSGAQTTSAKKRRVFSTQQPDMQPEKTDTNTVPATCDKG